VDEGTAIRYAEIYSNLEEKGTMIPLNDIWITAFAKQHAHSV
jgi:predicted nucleic acid-binding protein